MATVVRVNQQAGQRLAELGIDPAILRRAVEAGEMAGDACTEHDPPGFRGYTQWGVCSRMVRIGLAPLKWTRRNRQNLPLAVSPDGKMCITVATGDAATGIEEANPQTKNPRGIVTQAAIIENINQLFLFEEMEKERAERESEVRALTWILLFHRDRDIIRCELSLPRAWDQQGRVSEWEERLILEPVGIADVSRIMPEEQGPAIDVEVERKNVKEG